MRIGTLAERTGVSPRSLRYYEKEGLLLSRRTPSGQRLYVEADVDRVIRIQEFFAAGLCSRRIRELQPFWATCAPVARAALAAELRTDHDRLERQICDVSRSLRTLEEVIADLRESS